MAILMQYLKLGRATQDLRSEALFRILTRPQAALRGFLVVLAISLHAVFEGIAMGLTDNPK